MFKFLILILLICFANAQWREGVRDDRCPVLNGDFPTFLPGDDCTSFYKCNSGYRCKFNKIKDNFCKKFVTDLLNFLLSYFDQIHSLVLMDNTGTSNLTPAIDQKKLDVLCKRTKNPNSSFRALKFNYRKFKLQT